MSNTVQPKLRFPEFKGNWTESNLGSIATFSKGKGISKADIDQNGDLECIRYGELYTEYGEVIDEIKSRTSLDVGELVLSEANDVIIPASGETQIDIATASCVMKTGVALGSDLNIIKSPLNGIFLSYYLNYKKKYEIASIAQGISVVHLYASQLKTISINVPNTDEQNRIANFLRTIDNHVVILKRKKAFLQRYKDGVMQQLFSQKIRFQDENGKDFPEWEEKKLGEVGLFTSGTGFSNNEQGGSHGIPFLKVSDMNLKGNEKEIIHANHYVNQEQIERLKYKPISEPSIIFAKVGAAVFLERKRIASNFLIDNNMMSFTPRENIQFYKIVFDNIRLSKYAQTGALPSYNSSDLKTIKILIPSNSEQIKISLFINELNNRLQFVVDLLDKLDNFKYGVMQKMFV